MRGCRMTAIVMRRTGDVFDVYVGHLAMADQVGLRSGNYKLRVVREGSRDKLLPASTHPIENAPGRQDMGDNRIIYLWGSDRDDSLQLSIQEIPLDLR